MPIDFGPIFQLIKWVIAKKLPRNVGLPQVLCFCMSAWKIHGSLLKFKFSTPMYSWGFGLFFWLMQCINSTVFKNRTQGDKYILSQVLKSYQPNSCIHKRRKCYDTYNEKWDSHICCPHSHLLYLPKLSFW